MTEDKVKTYEFKDNMKLAAEGKPCEICGNPALNTQLDPKGQFRYSCLIDNDKLFQKIRKEQ